ncbi:MAG: PepSY domain-containing protein [Pseudomonadota bacterium]
MASKHVVSATLVAVLALVGAQAFAQPDEPQPLASPLTFNEAIAIALEEQPGVIAEIALERWQGDVVIDIEVVNEDGEYEFHLDPETGEILAMWLDDDPSDDPGETEDEDPDL